MKEKHNILIVDDSQDSLDLLGSQLENQYTVTAVTSVRAARHKLQFHRYHIALVDLVLPGENGLDLISEI